MMKSIERRATAAMAGIGLSAVLAACGGGGNESGTDTIQASPGSVEVSGPVGACYEGVGPKVFVFGGQPPYKLSNSAPQAMALDTTKLANSGDGFTVTFVNGICLTTLPITVEDAMGQVLPVPVSNVQGS